VAKTALDKHSQNDMLYNPKKATSIPSEVLKECDEVLDWSGIPLNSGSSMEEYLSIVALNK